MKKLLILVMTAALLCAAGAALAQNQYGGGYGMHGGMMQGYQGNQPQQSEEYQKYYNDTQQLRRKLAQDRAQLNAELMQDNPDPKKVRELNHSMADTRTELQLKAHEYGVQDQCPWCGGGMGPGMGGGMMGGGMGYGMHHGW